MEPLKTLGGGAFVHQTFAIGEDIANSGVPVILGAAAGDGIVNATTTASIGTLGITTDTASGATGQLVTVIVNPDLVLRAKLTQGSTEDTALTIGTVGASPSTTVADNITTLAPNSPDVVEGAVWGRTGVNAGLVRAITTAGANTITVVQAFPNAWGVGDTLLVCARFPGLLGGVQLSTLLTQVDAGEDGGQAGGIPATNDVGDGYLLLDGEYNDASDDGENNSFLHLVASHHAF